MTSPRLTESSYWDAGYESVDQLQLDVKDFRHRGERQLVEKIESLGLQNRKVLEVGAGNSAILTHLARSYGDRSSFSGLDYSENGCRLLRRRAQAEGVAVDVICEDLFDPSDRLLRQFDIVYSLGVVEHFMALTPPLVALSKLLHRNGRMLTIIPNLGGVLGKVAKRVNRSIYDLHVPHDLRSLVRGHEEAGLNVVSAGHIGSLNFGVLSSCFTASAAQRRAYLWLSRFTKLVWYLEDRTFEFPHSAALSPYIFVVSSPKE